jgi:hypothetical protein
MLKNVFILVISSLALLIADKREAKYLKLIIYPKALVS